MKKILYPEEIDERTQIEISDSFERNVNSRISDIQVIDANGNIYCYDLKVDKLDMIKKTIFDSCKLCCAKKVFILCNQVQSTLMVKIVPFIGAA